MIEIDIKNLGKRFTREWIFRELTLNVGGAEKIVITGSNGSGKSTLLQIISGYVIATEGEIKWKDQSGNYVNKENIYKSVSIASPALELVEEFTPTEIIKHQIEFKKFQNNLNQKELIDIAYLSQHKNKPVKYFSSGMKQRLKLMLSVITDAPLLLLDEPLINLDKNGISWYNDLISTYAKHKTIVVCSNNIKQEYEFCSKEISIDDFKKT